MKRVAGEYVLVDGSGTAPRAEAILDFLWEKGCTSEVKIRAVLGDSPDTSKALRMSVQLVKLDQVKRSGTGGRQNPFLYWVSESVDGHTI
ncbi:unnamed protein product [Spirodela intermedia]|uniref:HTH three-helical bundle domain-containing protein n=1 Tax=Spirodela intermedia TaxID=51605 RepID=A0A7I8JFK4_SPIIN|nr:unnamed protein product [Spirodela intermedia]CAA6668968.1 unnamed protein product [Spirodela intermedia]